MDPRPAFSIINWVLKATDIADPAELARQPAPRDVLADHDRRGLPFYAITLLAGLHHRRLYEAATIDGAAAGSATSPCRC